MILKIVCLVETLLLSMTSIDLTGGLLLLQTRLTHGCCWVRVGARLGQTWAAGH